MAIKFEETAVKNTYFGEDELQIIFFNEINKIHRKIEELDENFKNGKIKSLCGHTPERVYETQRRNLLHILERLEQGKTSLYDLCDIKGNIIGEYEPARFAVFREYFAEKRKKEEKERKEKENAEFAKNLKYNI